MRHPFVMPSRRFFPSSTLPLIGVTVPTVISADPHVVAARRRRTLLHQNARRREANHYIGCGCAHCQQSRKHQSQQSFLDHRLHTDTSRAFCLCQIALRVGNVPPAGTVRRPRWKQFGYVQRASPHGIVACRSGPTFGITSSWGDDDCGAARPRARRSCPPRPPGRCLPVEAPLPAVSAPCGNAPAAACPARRPAAKSVVTWGNGPQSAQCSVCA